MRIGLFGGSFDPIHNGHLEPVVQARQDLGLDKVFYLPTALPPHKPDRKMAPPWMRFAMVELALLQVDGCFASSYELTPGAPSYTVDTLEYYRDSEPMADLFLIVGSDSLASLHRWRHWQRILELAEIAVLKRPGWTPDSLAEGTPTELFASLASDRVHWVDHEPLMVSSTDLRRQLASGGSLPDGAVPDLVRQYIHKYALYR